MLRPGTVYGRPRLPWDYAIIAPTGPRPRKAGRSRRFCWGGGTTPARGWCPVRGGPRHRPGPPPAHGRSTLNAIPSHDTFTLLFAPVKTSTLQEVILPWLLDRRGLPGYWVPLDGKAMRHPRRTAGPLGALHVVSAWAGQTGLTLGQVAVDAK